MKVVITGPESTGKTTLSNSLAEHYDTNYVPEFARNYLLKRNGKYTEGDLLTIAKGQIELERQYENKQPSLLICDTSLEVIRVWSEWKYSNCAPFIKEQAMLSVPDLFLLLKPNIPWQPDQLRENPQDRDKLFTSYQKLLKEYKTQVVEISGDRETRMNSAIEAVEAFNS